MEYTKRISVDLKIETVRFYEKLAYYNSRSFKKEIEHQLENKKRLESIQGLQE